MRRLAAPPKTIAAVLLLCLAGAVAVFAGGGAERSARERLEEAEALVEERRYNDAILLLAAIVKEDPEAFDAAERLMQRIRTARQQYNDTYQELLVALFEDNDMARALELIDELQALDPDPTEATARSLRQARLATELVYNVIRFRDIMDEARALLERRQYRQAVDTYLEGFTLGRQTFEEAGYGNIVVGAVNGALERLEAAVPRFFDGSQALERETAALASGTGEMPPEELAESARSLQEQLEANAAHLATVGRSGTVFERQAAEVIQEIREGKPDAFLFFAVRLVFGREGEPPEGIAWAMRAVWDERSQAAVSPFLAVGDGALSRGLELYAGERHAEAREAVAAAEAPLRQALELQALWPLAEQAGRSLRLGGEERAAALEPLPEFLLTQIKLRETRDTGTLIEVADRVAALEDTVLATDEEVEAARRELRALEERLAELRGRWRGEVEDARAVQARGLPVRESVGRAEAVLARVGGVGERIAALDGEYLRTTAVRRGTELEQIFGDIRRRYEEGRELQDGREVPLEPVRLASGELVEPPPRIERFPTQAVEIYRPLRPQTKELLGEIESFVGALGADPEYLERNRAVARQVERARELETRVEQLQGELEERFQRADRDSVRAASRRQEGQLRLSEARADFQAREYAEARQNLDFAREAFDESLALEEDPEVRRIRDEEIAALLQRIIDEENQRVVREVRELINRGKTLYRQGDFAGAELALLQAQRRWNDTNPTQEEPEITLWLRFVRAALAATTGREIAETDPLHPEMTQLYNQAVADFEEGRRLLAANRRPAALERFRRAQERLTQILKHFPYNRDARLLALRIDQVEDPEEFARQIAELYRQAVDTTGRNDQEAYAILKDIESVQPRYPGLAQALANVEINLGVRQPPVDPNRLREATERYSQAQSLWLQQQPDLYPAALKLVNDAIDLNPDYDQAAVLKDRIQLAMGGTRAKPMTSDDRRLFENAVALFGRGAYFQALAVVRQLKARYPNDPELLDLERRILSRV
ncbi:MAG: hypothetical protein JW820_05210 [Spirochaetales bacterium]|nr:hypothetical protein [Spirochaetales bacterium]